MLQVLQHKISCSKEDIFYYNQNTKGDGIKKFEKPCGVEHRLIERNWRRNEQHENLNGKANCKKKVNNNCKFNF